jgi:hypothetical protein
MFRPELQFADGKFILLPAYRPDATGPRIASVLCVPFLVLGPQHIDRAQHVISRFSQNTFLSSRYIREQVHISRLTVRRRKQYMFLRKHINVLDMREFCFVVS